MVDSISGVGPGRHELEIHLASSGREIPRFHVDEPGLRHCKARKSAGRVVPASRKKTYDRSSSLLKLAQNKAEEGGGGGGGGWIYDHETCGPHTEKNWRKVIFLEPFK